MPGEAVEPGAVAAHVSGLLSAGSRSSARLHNQLVTSPLFDDMVGAPKP